MTDRETVTKVAEFHGHMCPGLALGIWAAEVALTEIGPHSCDEEVVAIVETDMCGVDAVQYLTGCTFGKGNLVHRDHGKNVFTFLRRSDRKAIRVSLLPGGFGPRDPERDDLRARVGAGAASDAERARLSELQQERIEHVLSAPIEELYEVHEVAVDPPRLARVHASVECADCGEPTMETRIRQLSSRPLCLPCFEQAMSGREPVQQSTRRMQRSAQPD